MAFKMNNPAMAKMAKTAGNNRLVMKMDKAMKMDPSVMKKDKRSLLQKAKDEAKQIKAGIKSSLRGNESRTRYGSSTIQAEIRDFKKGYSNEENKQAKKRKAGKAESPTKKKDKEASKTVKLKRRTMYPGDAVFEGSEKSKVDQRITNNQITKKNGKLVVGTNKSKSYTHYPEGEGSSLTEKSGKRTKTTMADGSTKLTKKRTLGGTKEFNYDAEGNLLSKTKRNKKGKITKSKGESTFSTKKLKGKGRKAKDFNKKEKAALSNVKTKYTG